MISTSRTASSPPEPALILHGGAGSWGAAKIEPGLCGLRAAAKRGANLLLEGASALDAVVAVVELLEDDPLFNAGTGAALNLDGLVEMDAAVMTSAGIAGGVCGLQDVRHPVAVARAVMEHTDHVLLLGEGAQRFARAMGFPPYDPRTPDRIEAWRERRDALLASGDDWLPKMRSLLERFPELRRGTVGAAAVDRHGALAAATSTGGVVLKLPGRLGDSAIPGAGNYANHAGASSATGRGEFALRTQATRRVAEAIEAGAEAGEAVAQVVRWVADQTGPDIGLIAVDHGGRVGAAHATEHMPHAWWTPREGVCANAVGTRIR